MLDAFGAFGIDRVQMLSWKTYVPTPEDDITETNPIRRIVYRRTPETAPVRKVLLPVSFLKSTAWNLPMGCHVLQNATTGDPLPSIVSAAITLAHFPVRSVEQFTARQCALLHVGEWNGGTRLRCGGGYFAGWRES